jgi:hypothetical protein
MKRLLLTLIPSILLIASIPFGLSWYDNRPETTDVQTLRLTKTLWVLQKQFDLTKIRVEVHAVRRQNMGDCHCWGREWDNYIEVMAVEDMPMSIPWEHRKQFQAEILQHEVMHIVLTNLGIPPDAQDIIIERLRPSEVQP